MRAVRIMLLAIIVAAAGMLAVSFACPFVFVKRHIVGAISDGSIHVMRWPEVLERDYSGLDGEVLSDPVQVDLVGRASRVAPRSLSIPIWSVLVVLAPAWFILYRRARELRRRALEGACAACGYDLTGNESGICPECGARL